MSSKDKLSKKPRAPKSTAKKPHKQNNETRPRPLLRSLRAASPLTRLGLIFGGLVAFGTISYVVVAVWQIEAAKHTAQAEHMPLVINSRPPQFLQPFVCDVRQGFHSGNMRRFVKNIGNATAIKVNPFLMSFLKVIPEHKRGNDLVDAPPVLNCSLKMQAVPMEFPLPPGVEKSVEIRQSAMNLPSLSADEPVQLYEADCVTYSDEYGNSHATCDTYQLLFPSTNPLDVISGSPTFFCDGKPKIGKFGDALTGHCAQ